MLYVAAVTVALSVALVVVLVADATAARTPGLSRRLAEIQVLGMDPRSTAARRRRQGRRARLERVLHELGTRLPLSGPGRDSLRNQLLQAGFDNANAVALFLAARALLAVGLGAVGFLVVTIRVGDSLVALGAAVYGLALGWILPILWVNVRRARRQKEIRRVLPDALDLLVVCVEAGLGLNQALVRLAQEISEASRELGKELALTNLQIRAGAPRAEALQGLADRTGLPEVQSLVTTITQTDRFGTSVARSLRVHSETLRTKRRQEAEEAAAKTTIKMVFPLVLCIFPALFVVILGPGLIEMAIAWIRGF